ncbi:hypothetical protein [uncultured Lacinutrix sp.]|uniref:IS1/IS1595 family N-terminal zinc-binding domain-containing protein n=1 Tax=uncultured Lacinutrix sp. TaxID=574032 RepID=UPI002608E440|nr:hypothetical protein [uncultured Lacinutrix sp.]
MKKVYCPDCNEYSVKSGFQKGKQRYKCKVCNKRFQLYYTYKAYNENTNSLIKSLLKESCSVQGISRVLNISCGTEVSC